MEEQDLISAAREYVHARSDSRFSDIDALNFADTMAAIILEGE